MAEICSFDVCALEGDGIWQKFNLDTGAAVTAFPQNQPGILRVAEPSGKSYKTASGEIVEDQGECVIKGSGEDTMLRMLRGRIAPVHKPLISAAAVRKKQNHIWIGPEGSGAIVPSTHAAAWYLRAAEKAMSESPDKCTWLYEESGVYNFYLRTPQKGGATAARDLSAAEPVTPAAGEYPKPAAAAVGRPASSSGGTRQARQL